mmetsp:Transcript_29801/g.58178  ORF Transcript_29801/g.58178 Transcript_29801/m.58178 type:complete len:275 (-) Transcript_29801:1078-1902(-)
MWEQQRPPIPKINSPDSSGNLPRQSTKVEEKKRAPPMRPAGSKRKVNTKMEARKVRRFDPFPIPPSRGMTNTAQSQKAMPNLLWKFLKNTNQPPMGAMSVKPEHSSIQQPQYRPPPPPLPRPPQQPIVRQVLPTIERQDQDFAVLDPEVTQIIDKYGYQISGYVVSKETLDLACGYLPPLQPRQTYDVRPLSIKRPDARSSKNCCDICGKDFRSRSEMNRHTRVHSGERPFQCKICFSKFKQKSHLKAHLAIHDRDAENATKLESIGKETYMMR